MSERAAKVLKIAIGAVIVAGVVAGAVVFVCKNDKARATGLYGLETVYGHSAFRIEG